MRFWLCQSWRSLLLRQYLRLEASANDSVTVEEVPLVESSEKSLAEKLSTVLKRAGVNYTFRQFAIRNVAFCSASVLGLALFMPFVPAIFGGLLLSTIRIARIIKRSAILQNQFAAEYPAALLGIAAHCKSGMSYYHALERTAEALPEGSKTREELERVLALLSRGSGREAAFASFAAQYSLPEVELFRMASCCACTYGGRVSPALERMAALSRDRAALIHEAHVSTTAMRMTANLLILLAPLLFFVVQRSASETWSAWTESTPAVCCFALGCALLIGGYGSLRYMSWFRP